jgi:hypothetical protein
MSVEATLGATNIIDIKIGSGYKEDPLKDTRIGQAIDAVVQPNEGQRGYYLSMLVDQQILRIVLPTVSRITGDLDPLSRRVNEVVSALVR